MGDPRLAPKPERARPRVAQVFGVRQFAKVDAGPPLWSIIFARDEG